MVRDVVMRLMRGCGQPSGKVGRQSKADRGPRTATDARHFLVIKNYTVINLTMRATLILLNILILSHHATTLSILAIISLPLRSHYMAFQKFFQEMAIRGHSVTVINNFPDSQHTPNLRFVDLKRDLHIFATLEKYEDENPHFMHWKNFKHFLTRTPDFLRLDCETLFTSVDAKSHLAEGNKYDVVFVEQFVSDCALLYAAAHYDAPIIGITSHVLLPSTYPALGIPFDFTTDSFFFTNGGPNPSLLSKLEAAVMDFGYKVVKRNFLDRNMYEVFEEHLPNVSLDVGSVAKRRMKMVFAYQHYSITGARLLAPQLLEIGGLHITQPKSVPKDVEAFLSTAEHGAVYVSFGSNLASSSMSPRMLGLLLDAFHHIPQKVLFKWENDTFPAHGGNVFTRKWFPQLDVLCHPKVLAFVSHGGMLSISEAVHCGKPMVTMPFFGDQFANAAAARAAGFAKTLFFARVTSENLVETLKELTSPEMQQTAQVVSKLWHDRPQPVVDSAIYWTEYVARHGAAPPSLPAKHNTWFESLLLDVASVVLLTILLLVWLICAICNLLKRILCVLICRKKEKRQ